MKFLFSLFFVISSAYAQNFNMNGITDFIKANTSQPVKDKKEKYEFIKKPKDHPTGGSYTITCWMPNGSQHPDLTGRQIKNYQINVTNYVIVFTNEKKASVPINNCFIFEN